MIYEILTTSVAAMESSLKFSMSRPSLCKSCSIYHILLLHSRLFPLTLKPRLPLSIPPITGYQPLGLPPPMCSSFSRLPHRRLPHSFLPYSVQIRQNPPSPYTHSQTCPQEPAAVFSLRKVAGAEGIIRVPILFSMADLSN